MGVFKMDKVCEDRIAKIQRIFLKYNSIKSNVEFLLHLTHEHLNITFKDDDEIQELHIIYSNGDICSYDDMLLYEVKADIDGCNNIYDARKFISLLDIWSHEETDYYKLFKEQLKSSIFSEPVLQRISYTPTPFFRWIFDNDYINKCRFSTEFNHLPKNESGVKMVEMIVNDDVLKVFVDTNCTYTSDITLKQELDRILNGDV